MPKSKKATKKKADKVTRYNVACGPGLRSWRTWGRRFTDLAMIETGSCAAYSAKMALEISKEKGKAMAKVLANKHYFIEYLVQDKNNNPE